MKTAIRLHIDQTMRTRNFRVQNEIVERGAVTKSQKEKKACVERKAGECYQWKTNGQCSKGDSCSFSHDPASGNRREDQRRTGQSSSPAPNVKAKTDGEIPSNSSDNRGESTSDKRGRIPCRFRKCNNPSCNYWHPPVCQNYKFETGCTYGNKCYFRHVEADETPNKKSKKGGAKRSVALLKESIQLGCVAQDSHPRQSTQRKEGKLRSNHAARFSKRHVAPQIKIRERKGPSRGIIQKREPHERSPCAPKFEERSQEETLHQERCARRAAWDLAKNIYKLDKTTLYSPIEAKATPAPTSKSPGGTRIRD